MKRISELIFSSVIFLSPVVTDASEKDDFKLVKQQGDVALYERWVTQPNQEQVRELKAVFKVQATVPTVISVFKNQQKGKRWNANAKTYHVLTGPDEQSWITYIKYAVPWPMDDQDACLSYQVRKNMPGEPYTELLFESTNHSSFPVPQNTSRITGTKGKWLLQPEPGGQLQVTYLVKTDRNKKFPRWMADPVIHNNLFKTITNLKQVLENK